GRSSIKAKGIEMTNPTMLEYNVIDNASIRLERTLVKIIMIEKVIIVMTIQNNPLSICTAEKVPLVATKKIPTIAMMEPNNIRSVNFSLRKIAASTPVTIGAVAITSADAVGSAVTSP